MNEKTEKTEKTEATHRPKVAMFTQDLDAIECVNPHCENHNHPLFLQASCHPRMGLLASYAGGNMLLRCVQCGDLICTVAVATADVQ